MFLLPVLLPLLWSGFIYPYFVIEVFVGLLFELLVHLVQNFLEVLAAFDRSSGI
jgi:hypothetical protein